MKKEELVETILKIKPELLKVELERLSREHLIEVKEYWTEQMKVAWNIYLVVGAPGSGKTTVCNQLTNEFEYIPHDLYPKTYIPEVLKRVKMASKPLLIETPFSVSKVMEPLNQAGYNVIPVFIIETPEVTSKRYFEREGKQIPQGHLTRIETYKQRANELKAFQGTSEQVLNHLKGIV